jgi:pimeloyl-ACP methyl ester carboxylesterase
MTTSGPRFLYAHGFASGPGSAKGVALSRHFEGQGLHLERLNLRVPSFEHLRFSAMLDVIRGAIGGERDRAVLFGSSLGGLAACRVAERDARACALVLLAPAFRAAERMRALFGDAHWRRYEQDGWAEVDDFAERRKSRIDFEFFRELEELETRAGPWPEVRVPVLIVHGVRDQVADPALSREWARGKRHVRLVEVDDTHELTGSIARIAAEADAFLRSFIGG